MPLVSLGSASLEAALNRPIKLEERQKLLSICLAQQDLALSPSNLGLFKQFIFIFGHTKWPFREYVLFVIPFYWPSLKEKARPFCWVIFLFLQFFLVSFWQILGNEMSERFFRAVGRWEVKRSV